MDKSNFREFGTKDNCFYLIEQLEEEYFSLFVIDLMPKSLEESVVDKFISEHETDGGSSSTGTYKEVKEDLSEFFEGRRMYEEQLKKGVKSEI